MSNQNELKENKTGNPSQTNKTSVKQKPKPTKKTQTTKTNKKPDLNSELQQKNKALNQAQLEIKKFKEDLFKLKDANLQLLVDMENLRKRTQREIEKNTQFASEKLIKELLPCVDCLEMSTLQKDNNFASLTTGVKMSFDMLIKVLTSHQVNFIEPKIGDPINPDIHEAITKVPNKIIKDNHIADIVQKGVLLNDRLIRSAKVVVADNPEN